MNQSNSTELDNMLNEIFLDIPPVNKPLRSLTDAADAVSDASCHEVSKVTSTKKFDPNFKAQALKLEEEIRSVSEQAIERLLASKGYGKGVDCKFKIHSSHRVSIKSSVDTGKAFTAIIHTILSREGALGKQAFIRAKVKQMWPNASVTKNWNQPLPIWAISNAKTRVMGLGAPFDSIKIKRGATLNDLHAASKAAVEKSQCKTISFRPEVLLSDAHLIVNGVPFAISQNKSGGKEYAYVRASTLKLQEALEKK